MYEKCRMGVRGEEKHGSGCTVERPRNCKGRNGKRSKDNTEV
jgi:hypothetical protein